MFMCGHVCQNCNPFSLCSAQVKMGLQLYKTPRNRYVLDVQKLYGETFVFMNVCARLMTELRYAHTCARFPPLSVFVCACGPVAVCLCIYLFIYLSVCVSLFLSLSFFFVSPSVFIIISIPHCSIHHLRFYCLVSLSIYLLDDRRI